MSFFLSPAEVVQKNVWTSAAYVEQKKKESSSQRLWQGSLTRVVVWWKINQVEESGFKKMSAGKCSITKKYVWLHSYWIALGPDTDAVYILLVVMKIEIY